MYYDKKTACKIVNSSVTGWYNFFKSVKYCQ